MTSTTWRFVKSLLVPRESLHQENQLGLLRQVNACGVKFLSKN
jgi:hypothetical protein